MKFEETRSLMDTYVKGSSKMVPEDELYPLLHEAGKDVILWIIEILRRIDDENALKDLQKVIKKVKGESKFRTEMISASEGVD